MLHERSYCTLYYDRQVTKQECMQLPDDGYNLQSKHVVVLR